MRGDVEAGRARLGFGAGCWLTPDRDGEQRRRRRRIKVQIAETVAGPAGRGLTIAGGSLEDWYSVNAKYREGESVYIVGRGSR